MDFIMMMEVRVAKVVLQNARVVLGGLLANVRHVHLGSF
jgi:hypothetical protein